MYEEIVCLFLIILLLSLFFIFLVKYEDMRDDWWVAYWIDYDIRWDKYWKQKGQSFPSGFESGIKKGGIDSKFDENKLYVLLLNGVVYDVSTRKSRGKNLVNILNNEFNYEDFIFEMWSGSELKNYVKKLRE